MVGRDGREEKAEAKAKMPPAAGGMIPPDPPTGEVLKGGALAAKGLISVGMPLGKGTAGDQGCRMQQ